MPLIKNIDQLKEYVSVNKNLKFLSIEPYLLQAERKFIKAIVGKAIYDDYVTTAPNANDTKKEVYNLLLEASANLSWFLYLPLAQVQVTDNGVAVSSGENYKTAEWWQIRDLRRSFADAGFHALDEAIQIMETNTGNVFDAWKTTSNYTIFDEVFVSQTTIFNKWFNISNSRRTFLALKPMLLESQYQYFGKLNEATIITIKAANTIITKEVLKMLQAAQTNFCIAKVAETGTFDLTSTGIYQKLEEFPGYKTKTLEKDQLQALKKARLSAAEQYYKTALDLIKANPTEFTNMNVTPAVPFVNPKNTKSIVSF